MTSTITRWSCPECGREFGSAPVSDETIGDPIHSPKWSAEFERNPQPCRGTPVARTYVAVDALLSDEAVDRAARAICDRGILALNGRYATWEDHADDLRAMAREVLSVASTGGQP